MKNHLGTLGLLVLFCKLFSTAYMFHSTNKYSYFLIVSNKFAILSLSSYSHIWEKTNNCGHKKNAARSITPLAAISIPCHYNGKSRLLNRRFSALERQIISRLACSGSFRLCWREWFRNCLWRNLCHRLLHRQLHFPCTDRVEPAVIPLACVDIKRHLDSVANNEHGGKLADSVVAEDLKTHLLGVLLLCLYHILLHLPWVARL